jgi:hypothetical protein
MYKQGGYHYHKIWFDFAFENNDLVSPSHTAMYLWFVELNNRLKWIDKFASPASQTMSCTGIKSYNTYKKIFNELVEFGFIKVITESKNQYTACIIAISKFDKAHNKALDKAIGDLPNQNLTTQLQSTIQSIDSIIKEDKPIETVKHIDVVINNNLFGEYTPQKKATKPKNIKPENVSYVTCKEFWLSEFHLNWAFNGVTGKSLKELIKKIELILKSTKDGGNYTDADVIATFKAMCIKLPSWYQDKDLPTLNSKFNEIIEQIKNLKNGKPTTNSKPISKYAPK